MNCQILSVFFIIALSVSASSYCNYGDQLFQIVCNGDSYISSQCYEEMEKVQTSIKQLKIVGCKELVYETENILSHFEGVLELDMSSLGLSILVPEKITILKLLKLNVSHNCLTIVESAIFEQTPNISEIDFSYNEISELNTFTAAPNLLMMNFSHNLISVLHTGTFSGVKELKVLDLSCNNIGSIEKEIFIENKKLEILRLEMNQIRRLDGNIFFLLINSVMVSVSFGDVREVDTSSVGQALYIDLERDNKIVFRNSMNNKLTCRKEDFKAMYYFNISGNQLQNTHDVIYFLEESSIEILDLSHNFLGNMNCTAFDRFENLRFLDLSHTNLTSISSDILLKLDKLKVLDLSYNRLSSLKIGAKVFSQIHTLHLEFNRLNEIDAITPDRFPSLTSLSITNNWFTCSYLERFLKNWSNLKLVATCKSRISNEIQETTETIDVVQKTTEAFYDIRETSEAFDTESSTKSDENSERTTENSEYTANFGDIEATFIESSPNTSEQVEISTDELPTEEASTEIDIISVSYTTEWNEKKYLKTEPSEEVALSDFWLQLQIVQFVLVVFCILYLVVNAIQRIIEADRRRNNTYDKEPQDEFQTIELNSQEFSV